MSFSLSLGNANARPRRERDNPTASQPDSLARLAYALRNRFFNRNPLRRARGAGVGGERGLSTRFSNHHKVSIRRQPRGSFGSNATLANRVTNTALSPALFGWGLRQRGVDNSVLQAPLSLQGCFNDALGSILLRLSVPMKKAAANKVTNTLAASAFWGGLRRFARR